jgi:MFS family permease
MNASSSRTRVGRRWSRLIPAILVIYIIAYIDRVNISFGMPAIAEEMGLDSGQIGFAAGIFFIGYIIFQVPGGYLAQRWSTKKLLIVLMVLWGLTATACGFVQSFEQLLALRLLLGVFEGGVQPALMVLIRRWFPEKERGRAFSLFILHNPIAVMIAGPFSGLILQTGGWRELFVIQGLLPIVIGLVVWILIAADSPASAKWLGAEERDEIARLHAADAAKAGPAVAPDWRVAFRSGTVWVLALACLCIWLGFYGLQLWLPTLLKESFQGDLTVGLVSAIPPIVAAIAIWFNGRGGDRDGRYALRTAVPLVLGGIILSLSTLVQRDQAWLVVTALALATACQLSFFGPFWALAAKWVPAAGVGVGFGLINGIGNLGGFLGPYLGGWLRDTTQSLTLSSLFFGASVALAGVIVLLVASSKARAQRTRPEQVAVE